MLSFNTNIAVYTANTRLALTLRHHGVTEFATSEVKDFQGLFENSDQQ